MEAVFFKTPADFRNWLEENHEKENELIVGFRKVGSGKPSITWSESVDQALCFGWIDGIRRSIDAETYSIRFTPRRPKSIWSAINIAKVEKLTELGLMRQAGLASYKLKEDNNSAVYSYENDPVKLDDSFEAKLKSNQKALEFFYSQPASYQNPVIRWVMSAKQEPTRIKRLDQLIADCEAGLKIKQMRYGK